MQHKYYIMNKTMKGVGVMLLLMILILSVKGQDINYSYMIVKTKGNILDCPHFGHQLANEASQVFQMALIEKDDKGNKVVYDVKKYNGSLDTLKIQYKAYLEKIQFPMNYFGEIYFSNEK